MSWVVPALMLLFLLWGMLRGKDVYGAFARGALEALPLVMRILPYMAAMMIALSAFRACGAMEFLLRLLEKPLGRLGFPPELLPMLLLRPFSGSASMALLSDVYAQCGVDSLQGFAASVMLGSTETIFYVIALYYGSIGIKKTGYTLSASLLATLAGAAASVFLSKLWLALA